MIRRHIESAVLAALADTPVVLISGARQTGKTTLARTIAARTGARYLTFDDAATLGLAAADPAGFIGGLPGRVVLDEIQKAPSPLPRHQARGRPATAARPLPADRLRQRADAAPPVGLARGPDGDRAPLPVLRG